jgi:hypothetical protein
MAVDGGMERRNRLGVGSGGLSRSNGERQVAIARDALVKGAARLRTVAIRDQSDPHPGWGVLTVAGAMAATSRDISRILVITLERGPP